MLVLLGCHYIKTSQREVSFLLLTYKSSAGDSYPVIPTPSSMHLQSEWRGLYYLAMSSILQCLQVVLPPGYLQVSFNSTGALLIIFLSLCFICSLFAALCFVNTVKKNTHAQSPYTAVLKSNNEPQILSLHLYQYHTTYRSGLWTTSGCENVLMSASVPHQYA